MAPGRSGRRSRVAGALVGVAALVSVVLVSQTHAWLALGARAMGARLQRMQRSHHWANGRFVNPEEIRDDLPGALTAMFHLSPDATPRDPVNVLHPDPALFATPPPSGLRVTWFGHSSTLVEIDGLRILTDPLWSNTAPSTSHDRGRPAQPRLARLAHGPGAGHPCAANGSREAAAAGPLGSPHAGRPRLDEPIERALVAAEKAGVAIVAPRPGESFEPSSPPPVRRWWPNLPWNTAEQDPIVSTQME